MSVLLKNIPFVKDPDEDDDAVTRYMHKPGDDFEPPTFPDDYPSSRRICYSSRSTRCVQNLVLKRDEPDNQRAFKSNKK